MVRPQERKDIRASSRPKARDLLKNSVKAFALAMALLPSTELLVATAQAEELDCKQLVEYRDGQLLADWSNSVTPYIGAGKLLRFVQKAKAALQDQEHHLTNEMYAEAAKDATKLLVEQTLDWGNVATGGLSGLTKWLIEKGGMLKDAKEIVTAKNGAEVATAVIAKLASDFNPITAAASALKGLVEGASEIGLNANAKLSAIHSTEFMIANLESKIRAYEDDLAAAGAQFMTADDIKNFIDEHCGHRTQKCDKAIDALSQSSPETAESMRAAALTACPNERRQEVNSAYGKVLLGQSSKLAAARLNGAASAIQQAGDTASITASNDPAFTNGLTSRLPSSTAGGTSACDSSLDNRMTSEMQSVLNQTQGMSECARNRAVAAFYRRAANEVRACGQAWVSSLQQQAESLEQYCNAITIH